MQDTIRFLQRGCRQDQLIMLLKTLEPVTARCDSIGFHVVVSSSAPSKQDDHCCGVGVVSCVDLQLAVGGAKQTFRCPVNDTGLDIMDFWCNGRFKGVPISPL